MTIAVLVVCGIAVTYLYVMGLCYLCDLYTLRQKKKQEAAERRRKAELQMARYQAEARRKQDIELRKKLAKARKNRGTSATGPIRGGRVGSGRASAARA